MFPNSDNRRRVCDRLPTHSICCRKVRSIYKAILLLCISLLLSSCSSNARTSSAAPPTVICGTTLWDSPSGASAYNYFKPGDYQVNERLRAGQLHPIILRLSSTCSLGVATVAVAPQGLLKMKMARAKNNSIVAVAISGLLPGSAIVTASDANGLMTKVRVSIIAS